MIADKALVRNQTTNLTVDILLATLIQIIQNYTTYFQNELRKNCNKKFIFIATTDRNV